MEKRGQELSRGMKVKLMLAVAMSYNAKLLILDEPTSGLDPVARDELLDILEEYIDGGQKSILFSTHITSDLEKIADYITLIDHGSIFYTGTQENLLAGYYAVRGERRSLTDSLKGQIIGLKSTAVGFEGLLPASGLENLSSEIAVESPSIDEILVAISKGGGNHA